MKAIYIIGVIVVSLAVGYWWGSSNQGPAVDVVSDEVESIATSTETSSNEEVPTAQPSESGVVPAPAPAAEPAKSVVIETSSLPAAQQQALQMMGITESQITITPAMQACAQAKLGDERLQAILAGDTPGFLEAATLLGCYKDGTTAE